MIVRHYLHLLHKALPTKPTAVDELYSLPKSLDYAFNGPTKQKEKALQQISDHMLNYLGVLPKVHINFVDKEQGGLKTKTVFYGTSNGRLVDTKETEYIEETKYAGLYKVIGADHGRIIIVNDPKFYLIHFLAVLAHEITHNYLYYQKFSPEKDINLEILTDIAAVYLGFGPILIRGYKPSTAINYKLGYVNIASLRSALAYSCYLRNWKYKEVINKFEWFEFEKHFFRLRLISTYCFKRFKKNKEVGREVTGTKTIVLCTDCLKKLKIPIIDNIIKVTCPHCNSSFHARNGKILKH